MCERAREAVGGQVCERTKETWRGKGMKEDRGNDARASTPRGQQEPSPARERRQKRNRASRKKTNQGQLAERQKKNRAARKGANKGQRARRRRKRRRGERGASNAPRDARRASCEVRGQARGGACQATNARH
eukprot:589042-Rhodomonas_salina.2